MLKRYVSLKIEAHRIKRTIERYDNPYWLAPEDIASWLSMLIHKQSFVRALKEERASLKRVVTHDDNGLFKLL
jgi:hypothetical protein